MAFVKKLNNAHEKCSAGAISLKNPRCSVETRQLLLQNNSQVPSMTKKVVLTIERITLWLVAIGGFVIALIAILRC